MLENIDKEHKRVVMVWTPEDVQDLIDDMAGNGFEYHPALTEDEKFEALEYATEIKPDVPMNNWKITDALYDLYHDRMVQTDGEGNVITEEDVA